MALRVAIAVARLCVHAQWNRRKHRPIDEPSRSNPYSVNASTRCEIPSVWSRVRNVRHEPGIDMSKPRIGIVIATTP